MDRRRRTGAAVPEGAPPYVLTALGGGSLALLWLKLGGLVGARRVSAADFGWDLVIVVTIGGALICLVAQLVWGALGPHVAVSVGGRSEQSRLRAVWGLALFPQVISLMLLLPIDVLLVGRQTFTTEHLTDRLATAWAALSIAFALSLAAWSIFLLFRGVQSAMGLRAWSAVAATVIAMCILALTVLAVAAAARGLAA
jgi:hypothetical protein